MLDLAIQFFFAGGWVMYPLLFLSLLSITLIFERCIFWFIGPERNGLKRLNQYIGMLSEQKLDQARTISQQDGTLEGGLVRGSLERGYRSEAALIGQIEAQRPGIERFATTLGTVIAAAPLLGILGTVTGIIRSFDLLGEASAISDPALIAGGIAEALYTTAFGLSVALVTLFPHVVFKSKADRALGRLEILAGAIVDASRSTD